MTVDFWQAFFSFITGGTLIGVLTWVISNRKDNRAGLQTVIDNFALDNTRLRKEVEDLRIAFDAAQKERYKEEGLLRQEVTNLRNQLLLMESAHLDLPIPQWLKDKNGVMLALNDSFERVFLEPMGKTASDYIGKMDGDVWPPGNAEAFTRSDNVVVRSRKPYQFEETINYGDYLEVWDVLKYPRYSGRTYIGTAGIAFKKIKQNTTPAQT